MKHSFLYILLLVAALVLFGCADDVADVPAGPSTNASAERVVVPHTFEATLGGAAPSAAAPATRADIQYGEVTGGNGLSLTWGESDKVGVYIRTEKGTILRAGSLNGSGVASEKTRKFSGYVLQKFEGERYLYMHPDLGQETTINFSDQYGHLGSPDHLNDYLPIVWDETAGRVGTYKGYAIRLLLTFTSDPGPLRKIMLMTSPRGSGEDRIFPRAYSIGMLTADGNPFTLPAGDGGKGTFGTAADAGTYTSAVSLTLTGDATPTRTGVSEWTAEAYIASATVENLNLYDSHLYVHVINSEGKTFLCTPVQFKGQQSASAGNKQLLATSVFPNGSLRKMTTTLSEGSAAPTVINYQYKVNSLMGMWNQYGRPYDPFHLMVYGGEEALPAEGSGTMPDQLIRNMFDLRTRSIQSLTGGTTTATPTHTWVLYESQCPGYKNTTYITNDGSANTNHGSDHSQKGTTINNIEITAPTEVYFTFLGEYAWWQNLIGYYHYPKGSVPASQNDVTKTIIFPNVSKPGHEPFNDSGKLTDNIGKATDAPLKQGETVKLLYTAPDGTVSDKFPADEVIGFFLMQNPQANGFQQSAFSLMNWNVPIYFTNQAWNALYNRNWPTTGRLNTFASADVCNVTGASTGTKAASTTKIPGIAFYGAMDDINKRGEVTAWSAMLFAVSTSDPAAMKTQNHMYFNIGTGITAVMKADVND